MPSEDDWGALLREVGHRPSAEDSTEPGGLLSQRWQVVSSCHSGARKIGEVGRGSSTNKSECRGNAYHRKVKEFTKVASNKGCPETYGTKSKVILSHVPSKAPLAPATHTPRAHCSPCLESLSSSDS